MNHSDIAALMKGIAPVIGDLVQRAVRPLQEEIASLRTQLDEMRSFDHLELVRGEVDRAVSALPPAPAGRDADPALITELIIAEVAKLPTPAAGRDADPALVAELVRVEVSHAVAALPPAPSGKDADPGLIADLVAAAVTKVPPPVDGKDADPALVAELVRVEVERAVAALPPAQPGKEGPAGKLPMVREWTDEVAYEGDVRTWKGSTWQAARDTAKEPPHADWVCLAAAGQSGADADQIEVIGTFDDAAAYKRLNIVALNGAAFIARKDNPGACPGEGWQVIAMRGKPGPPGEAKTGAPGMRGLPGPGVAGLSLDEMGLLTLRNADGTELTCDFYDLLSKRP